MYFSYPITYHATHRLCCFIWGMKTFRRCFSTSGRPCLSKYNIFWCYVKQESLMMQPALSTNPPWGTCRNTSQSHWLSSWMVSETTSRGRRRPGVSREVERFASLLPTGSGGVVGQCMFAFCRRSQKECKMCIRLKWRLNVRANALKGFRSVAQRVRTDFKGPNFYPARYTLPTPFLGSLAHPKSSTGRRPMPKIKLDHSTRVVYRLDNDTRTFSMVNTAVYRESRIGGQSLTVATVDLLCNVSCSLFWHLYTLANCDLGDLVLLPSQEGLHSEFTLDGVFSTA